MPPSAEKLGADELAEALLESLACETRVRAILPLHASDWQAGALALAVLAVREDVGPCAASAWLMAVLARLDPSKSRAPGRKRSSVHSVCTALLSSRCHSRSASADGKMASCRNETSCPPPSPTSLLSPYFSLFRPSFPSASVLKMGGANHFLRAPERGSLESNSARIWRACHPECLRENTGGTGS